MKIADVMIVWTPDREPFSGPDRGDIRAVVIPEPSSTEALACSTGACDGGWAEKTDAQRLNDLVALKGRIVREDNIPERTVHGALQAIDEYRASFP